MDVDALSRDFPTDDAPSDNSPHDHDLPHMDQYLVQLHPNSASTSYQYGPSTSKTTLDAPSQVITAEHVDDEMLSDEDAEADEDMEDVEEDVDAEGEEEEVDEEVEEEEAESQEEDEEETDEEATVLLKPRDERMEIEDEMLDLEAAVPHLAQDYKLIDRLGTGTFSAVYKAIDLGYHTKWSNSEWHGNHPPSSSAHYQSVHHLPDRKVFVAVKRIYVTSGPERIRNEIAIMEDCRGCRHVSQIITAFRHLDQVVVVMPYQRNDDFRVSNPLMAWLPSICVFLMRHHRITSNISL